MAADELALARHPELAAIGVAGCAGGRPPTGLERQALDFISAQQAVRPDASAAAAA